MSAQWIRVGYLSRFGSGGRVPVSMHLPCRMLVIEEGPAECPICEMRLVAVAQHKKKRSLWGWRRNR